MSPDCVLMLKPSDPGVEISEWGLRLHLTTIHRYPQFGVAAHQDFDVKAC